MTEFKTTPSVFIHMSPGGPVFYCQPCHRQDWHSGGRYLCRAFCQSELTPVPTKEEFYFCHACGLILTPEKREDVPVCGICRQPIWIRETGLSSIDVHITCVPANGEKGAGNRSAKSLQQPLRSLEARCKRCNKSATESPRYHKNGRPGLRSVCIACMKAAKK